MIQEGMTKEEKEFICDTLRIYLSDGMCIPNPVAIYRHDDGHLSQHPFSGSHPPIAGDGSDEVIHVLRAGCYYVDPNYEIVIDPDIVDAAIEEYQRQGFFCKTCFPY